MRIHITPGPSPIFSDLREVEARWCFGCRKRTRHHWVLHDDLCPSFYDPIWSQNCDECGKDETRFPGC